MALSNIERFNITAVQALAELYSQFPMRKNLASNRFILTDEGERAVVLSAQDEAFADDGDPTYSGRKEFAFETLNWLVEAGYIQGRPVAYERIENAVLTSKGLEVLKMTPDSLQGTLGDRLLEAAKGSAGAVCGALVSQIAGFSFRLLG